MNKSTVFGSDDADVTTFGVLRCIFVIRQQQSETPRVVSDTLTRICRGLVICDWIASYLSTLVTLPYAFKYWTSQECIDFLNYKRIFSLKLNARQNYKLTLQLFLKNHMRARDYVSGLGIGEVAK